MSSNSQIEYNNQQIEPNLEEQKYDDDMIAQHITAFNQYNEIMSKEKSTETSKANNYKLKYLKAKKHYYYNK